MDDGVVEHIKAYSIRGLKIYNINKSKWEEYGELSEGVHLFPILGSDKYSGKVWVNDSNVPDHVCDLMLQEYRKLFYPSATGLYPQEILVLFFATKIYEGQTHFQCFWNDDYFIKDVMSVLHSLKTRGYIEDGNLLSTLENSTNQKLYDCLKNFGLKRAKDKKVMAKRLVENGNIQELEKLFPKKTYKLTDKGKKELEENDYVIYCHRYTRSDELWRALLSLLETLYKPINELLYTKSDAENLSLIFNNKPNADMNIIVKIAHYEVSKSNIWLLNKFIYEHPELNWKHEAQKIYAENIKEQLTLPNETDRYNNFEIGKYLISNGNINDGIKYLLKYYFWEANFCGFTRKYSANEISESMVWSYLYEKYNQNNIIKDQKILNQYWKLQDCINNNSDFNETEKKIKELDEFVKEITDDKDNNIKVYVQHADDNGITICRVPQILSGEDLIIVRDKFNLEIDNHIRHIPRTKILRELVKIIRNQDKQKRFCVNDLDDKYFIEKNISPENLLEILYAKVDKDEEKISLMCENIYKEIVACDLTFQYKNKQYIIPSVDKEEK